MEPDSFTEIEPHEVQVVETVVDGGTPEEYRVKITIETSQARPESKLGNDYRPVVLYGIEIETTQKGALTQSWEEGFGGVDQVYAFLRGVQAGAQMTGGPYLSVPGVRGLML